MGCAFNASKKSAPKKTVIYKSFVGYKIKSKTAPVKKIGKENIVDSKKASIKSVKKKKYLTNIFIKNLFAQKLFEARQTLPNFLFLHFEKLAILFYLLK